MKIIRVYKDLELTNELGYSTEEEIEFFHKQEELGTFGVGYEAIVEDLTEQLEQSKINEEALAYLSSTDFYIIREMDTGVPCPEEIREARQDARDRIK